jgi:SAM-dependent methyltransferase
MTIVAQTCPVVTDTACGAAGARPGVSGFFDVDSASRPAAFVESLQRRANAALYEPYREFVDGLIADSRGIVLDVGCGIGERIQRIQRLGRPVIGVDPSWVMASSSQSRVVVQGRGERLPFGAGSVGTVVLERVLQHCTDIAGILGQAASCVGIGGLIVCIDPLHGECGVMIDVDAELRERVVAWRRTAGVASPDVVDECAKWGGGLGSVSVERFECRSSDFVAARAIADFPNWSRCARIDGADVSGEEVVDWERCCSLAREGLGGFELSYPVAVSTIRV